MEKELEDKIGRPVTQTDVMSYIMYPQVFLEKEKISNEYGRISALDTPTFFYGLRPGEEVAVEIEQGKTLIVKLMSIGSLSPEGNRIVYFELNGQPRQVTLFDRSAEVSVEARRKADASDEGQIGASMPGKVLKVMVEPGDEVEKGEDLIVTEAMKMETTVQSPFPGRVKAVHAKAGDGIESGDLLLELEKRS